MNLVEYRLNCLAEECAEVIQAVSKVKRFGLSRLWAGSQQTNRQRLIAEVKDVLTVIRSLGHTDIPRGDQFTEFFDLVVTDDDIVNNLERMKAHERLARELGQLGTYSYVELSSKNRQLLAACVRPERKP